MILHYMIHILLAGIGTLAFTILFHTKRSEYVLCIVSGMVSWFLYLLFFEQFDTGAVIASLAASLMLTIFARLFAVIRKEPVTTYLVTGIFTLVPGYSIYYTAYYLIMAEYETFFTTAAHTIKVALAIAIGIIIGFAVPQKFFRWLAGRRQKHAAISQKD